jgi:hypothetical protein
MYVATNSRLSGDGLPSGVGYQASQDAFDQFSYADPFPLEETVHVDLQLQSQTGVDNYHVGFDIHLTFNANGVPTATTNKFIDRCNG